MNDLYFKHIFFNSISYSVNHNEYYILALLILLLIMIIMYIIKFNNNLHFIIIQICFKY